MRQQQSQCDELYVKGSRDRSNLYQQSRYSRPDGRRAGIVFIVVASMLAICVKRGRLLRCPPTYLTVPTSLQAPYVPVLLPCSNG